MHLFFNCPPLHWTFCLVITLSLSFSALAQSAPTWQSASAIGPGSSYGDAVVDAAGNTYETGDFQGTIVVAGTTLTSQGGFDGYIAKYTPTGTLAWVRQLGSAGTELPLDIVADAAGNAYVTGYFTHPVSLGNGLSLTSGTATTYKAFLIRYSPQGVPEWVQQSSVTSTYYAGGGALGLDALGNVYQTGQFYNDMTVGTTTITAAGSGSGTYLARFSATTGALQYLARAFYHNPSPLPGSYAEPKLCVSPTGEAYILNSFNAPAVVGATTLTSRGNDDILIAKYGAQGILEWVQQLGGGGYDDVRGGKVDANGNLYVVAIFTGAATLGTTTLPGYGDVDGCLIKYSAQGALQWAQASGGTGRDLWNDVALDAIGNPYVVGSFSNIAQFGSTALTSAGNRDIAVAAYTPQGQIRWVQRAGGTGLDVGSFIGIAANGEVHVLGDFTGNCTFGTLTLSTTAVSETFVARLGNTTLSTRSNQTVAIELYPNPASNTVHLPAVPIGSQVQLLDAVGRIVRIMMVTSGANVSLQGVPPGLYVVRATHAQGRQYSGRLVVE